MNMDFDLPLAGALPELRKQHGPVVTYMRLYMAVIQGDVPAEKRANRWYLRRADLPKLAIALGVAAPAA
jgi:hypothetical protein